MAGDRRLVEVVAPGDDLAVLKIMPSWIEQPAIDSRTQRLSGWSAWICSRFVLVIRPAQ
jgi:hypothetical protein